MDEAPSTEKNTTGERPQPTYRQMGRYALEGILFTIAATPLAYLKWMKRSPFPWLSKESFHGFGTIVLILGVLLVLARIGSHGDKDEA